ncbi:cytochrome-c peroxidase [Flavobacterium cheongpyeongense]|uniref:Cytochrome-c peroxidase n=1 Tax=Flavobacterium cheongpyeongense TaxID=2212651 RepID=A0A2V4BTZ7_9FLAO|nr:cytochrome c peroxidase [Flavobacterium cheongpyeongense]PXY42127.1 cytochrome-c peroxidase [Flavobacterium cheongpyeongense]
MLNRIIKLGSITGLAFLSFSCNDFDDNYQEPLPLVLVPDNFPEFVDSKTNPLTSDGVLLGKKLFFDKRLSGNNKVSCATCHQQSLAFSDGFALTKQGISGNALERNSPALINLAWANNGLFWDGGSTNLESQAFAPLAHVDEMHQNLDELLDELKEDTDYPKMFQRAFGKTINQADIVKAIAQFERTLISSNSRYDKYVRGESGGILDQEELEGLKLAEQFCFSCHAGSLMTDNLYHNNGIDNDFTDDSELMMRRGRARITGSSEDLGKFRTPTLRNIEKTGPYMHDGRLGTLEAVLEHYSNSVLFSSTLDPLLRKNGNLGIPLSETEKKQLIAFLKTLTDYAYINDKRFSE